MMDNIFVDKFNQFKHWMEGSNLSEWDSESLFAVMTSVKERDGYEMRLHLASEANGSGDNSYFYFEDRNGEEDREIEKYLTVEPTQMGAWELYLLKMSYTQMPCFWHGGYNMCDYIFRAEDLIEAGGMGETPIKDRDLLEICEQYDLTPDVVMSSESGTSFADVFCCLWNDWRGLYREHCRVVFKDRSTSIETEQPFVIYRYDCRIFF